MKLKERNYNIDLVKCIAVFSVLSVHFFLNTNFYTTIVNGKLMYAAIFFRTIFMICVPLFLITTGYLMKNKELTKKYYFNIFRVLFFYLTTCILIILYKMFFLKEYLSLKDIAKGILTFDIGYSWYIEMYLGLFILIPFLNILYNNLKDKKSKKALIFVFIILTSIQGIFNIKYTIVPNWYISLYPFTYYFIGCYIREYKIDISKFKNILMFLLIILISSTINYIVSKNTLFVRDVHNDWGSLLNLIPSCLVFIFIINLNLQNINYKYKKIFYKISVLSLGIYLTSALTDNFLYNNYFKNDNLFNIKGYLMVVPASFIIATILSSIINSIYKMVDKYYQKAIHKINI